MHEERVDSSGWRARCLELAADGARMLDFLTAVDRPDDVRIDLVVHLVDIDRRERHLVTTTVARSDPRLASLLPELPGAAWHEREVHEMFGVVFEGNADLRPLLTTGEAGWPLRRTTPLPARLQNPWPGAAEPAPRSTGGRVAARPRARQGPPGIPAEWA
jgi:NADH:ubiquinone oxidoreductase subunit C